jgi:putative flippase GtrA
VFLKSRLKEELDEVAVTLPRYIAVGIVGAAIGMATIWCFTELVGLYYFASGCLAAFLSLLSDFTFNEIWTFSHRGRAGLFTIKLAKRFAKFVLSKAAGFLIGISVLALFTQVIGWHYLVSNLLAIGASFTWNYTTSSFWVWAGKR